MKLTEQQVPAYVTSAFDTSGKLIIQQIQYRMVLFRDGVPDAEGKLLPIQLIKAPLPGDTIEATLKQALDAVTAGQALLIAEHEATIAEAIVAHAAEVVAKDANVQELLAKLATVEGERDRLRSVVDTFVIETADPTPDSSVDLTVLSEIVVIDTPEAAAASDAITTDAQGNVTISTPPGGHTTIKNLSFGPDGIKPNP